MRPSNNLQRCPRYSFILFASLAALGMIVGLSLTHTKVAASPGPDSNPTFSGQDNSQSLNKWSSNGPDGGEVLSLAIDPSNPATIYAGTAVGLFKSTNGGATWSISLAGGYIKDLVVYAPNPNIIYAGSSKSTDGGLSWQPMNLGGHPFAVDPTNPNILHAVVYQTVITSTDGGATWNTLHSHLNAPYQFGSVAIDPTNPNIIYAAGGNGVPTAVFVVYKSSNGDLTWNGSQVTSQGHGTVNDLIIDPANTSVLYLATDSGLFKSTNGAQSWSPVSVGLIGLGINAVAIDPGNSSVVYAGTNGGVFKSNNGGASWNPINSGITNTKIKALAIDPTNNAVTYAGTGAGVFKSNNSAATWSPINGGLHNVYVAYLAIDCGNSNVIYAASNVSGLFKSADNGGSWSGITNGLPGQISALASDQLKMGTVYVGVYDPQTYSGGVYKSTDGGATWNSANNGLHNFYVSSLAIDPGNSEVLYTASDTLFKSTNGGQSWSAIGNLVGPLSVAIDPSHTQTLYATSAYVCNFGDCNYTIFKSTDGGLSWARSDTGTPFSYASTPVVDPINSQNIYISAYLDSTNSFGLFKSTNGGASWNEIGGAASGSIQY